MKTARTGIILNVENYGQCVAFYRDLFGLKIMHEKVQGDFKLTCLDFGGSYLLIEMDGVAKSSEKTMQENPTKLRFNVDDLQVALAKVHSFGIDAEIETYSWGSTINLVDPDGNRVGIRDEPSFGE